MSFRLDFKEIYDRHYDSAYLFVCSYIYDVAVVEDIVSESLIKLWHELKNKEGKEHNIKAFLFSIKKNMSLDHLRHQSVKQKVLDKLSSAHQREMELRITSLKESEYNGNYSAPPPNYLFIAHFHQNVLVVTCSFD